MTIRAALLLALVLLAPASTRGFDPAASAYDYETALTIGYGPDDTGHWPSRDYRDGALLKGRQHPTWDLTVAQDEAAGYTLTRGLDGRYYTLAPRFP